MKHIFLSGFSLILALLGSSFILSCLCYPLLKPDAYVGIGPQRGNIGVTLFYIHPLLYTALYSLLDGFWAGIMALIAAASYFLFLNQYVALLFPFLLYYVLFTIGNFTGHKEWMPNLFTVPGNGISMGGSVIEILIFAAVALASWIRICNFKEIIHRE